MVNKIIDGISIKLNQVFRNGYRIYSEDVKQGLKEPCFFIAVLGPSETNRLDRRYLRQNPFDIHYFPSDSNSNIELQAMASELYEALEWITVEGNSVRGVQMYHETVGGVLHFFVQYNLHVVKLVTAADPMETLDVINGIEE